MVVICGRRGEGGGEHELLRDDHVLCAVYIHLARCKLNDTALLIPSV